VIFEVQEYDPSIGMRRALRSSTHRSLQEPPYWQTAEYGVNFPFDKYQSMTRQDAKLHPVVSAKGHFFLGAQLPTELSSFSGRAGWLCTY